MKEENPLNRRIESFLERIGAARAADGESAGIPLRQVGLRAGSFTPVTLTDEDIVDFRIENLN